MISPSLTFDFTSASLDSRITFARAGATATRVNSSGYIEAVAENLPRFDYDPITLACRGLLIEDAKINLANYSQQFNQTSQWGNNLLTINPTATTAPDNTTTGNLLSATASAGGHYVTATLSVTSGVTYTFSAFVKAGGNNFCRVALSTGFTTASVWFNTLLGTIGTVQSGVTATISPFGNGWHRITVTGTATSTTATGRYFFTTEQVNGGTSYTGDGTSGTYYWGAQVEVGASATSYIRTVASAVTRNADVATITGTDFSDWWQTTRGGVLVRARPGTVSGTRPWVQFDDNTADNIIALRGNTTNPELYIVDGGTPQAQIDAGTIAANTDYSLTGWWATNDCKARLNNGAVVTDTSATIPTVTQARLGSDGTNYLNGHLASISYYDSFFGRRIYTRRKNKVISNLM
jgi:hypothetical protein